MSTHAEKRKTLLRLSRRQTFLLSALVGAAAGCVAVFFRLAVSSLELFRVWLSHQVQSGPLIWLALAAAGACLGGLAAWVTQRYCREAGGSGIPHIQGVLLGLKQLRPLRLLAVKLGAGLLALASGMSLGREGPTVHLGGACGSLVGSWVKAPARTHKSLIAAGAGAGLAAAFNAPLAGFLFIMEELRRDMSRMTYGSALVSSVAAVAVARLTLGQQSTFGLLDSEPIALQRLPVVALVALTSTLVGLAFNFGLLRVLAWRDRARKPLWVAWGALAGCLGGVFLLLCPDITGGGHLLTEALLSGGHGQSWLPLGLALLVVGKLLFTLLCYATGVPGGIFAPLLTLGAMTGYGLGLFFGAWWPSLTPTPELLATIGMAAVLTGSVRAPLTGIVLIVEMTGRYHLLYALLLAALVAYALAERVESEPIYESLLRRDLQRAQERWKQQTRVVELQVGLDSQLHHVPLSRFPAHEDLLIAMIERDGKVLIPHGSTVVEGGDLLTLLIGPTMDDHALNEFMQAAKGP